MRKGDKRSKDPFHLSCPFLSSPHVVAPIALAKEIHLASASLSPNDVMQTLRTSVKHCNNCAIEAFTKGRIGKCEDYMNVQSTLKTNSLISVVKSKATKQIHKCGLRTFSIPQYNFELSKPDRPGLGDRHEMNYNLTSAAGS